MPSFHVKNHLKTSYKLLLLPLILKYLLYEKNNLFIHFYDDNKLIL